MFDPATPYIYELSLSINNLYTGDENQVDCQCILYLEDEKNEVNRTEVIIGEPHPQWENKIRLPLSLPISSKLIFLIINPNNNNQILARTESLLWLIAQKETLKRRLGNQNSYLHIKIQEIEGANPKFAFSFKGISLDSKDFGGGSDPYLIFKKTNQFGIEFYRTEVIKNNLNPIWKNFVLSLNTLTDNNLSNIIRIECWDWDRIGSDDFIGCEIISVERMISPACEFYIYETEDNRLSNKKSGKIQCKSLPILSFLGYLRAGLRYNFTFAVDFSKNNTELHRETAMIYSYYNALGQIGANLEPYDHDNIFFLYGLGAHINRQNSPNQCFALSKNESGPQTKGSRGLQVTYLTALNWIDPANVCCLNKVIEKSMEFSRFSPPEYEYNILIIFTYGSIDDIEQTISTIIDASMLPMSIILIGMGNGSTRKMEKLCCSEELKRIDKNSETYPARNIVQFYSYQNYTNNTAKLVTEMMNKIPKQVEDYMSAVWHCPVISNS